MATKQPSLFPVNERDRGRAEAQIREKQREIRFITTDFVIEFLVQKFREESYYIPDYQRQYVWRNHHKCAFIESVLLGLPIPLMFFAEIDDGRLEIVDGAQRMYTLEAFMNDDLALDKLNKLPSLREFRYSDLPVSQQRKFASRPLRIVILDESTSVESRLELFMRINTKGEKARPAEVRRGALSGPFMDFLKKCVNHTLFGRLCPISKSLTLRREPEELILRFFAYSDRYKSFRHDVYSFLDSFVAQNRSTFDRARMLAELGRTLQFVQTYFPYGFAKTPQAKMTPRVRFEAISVGVNLALRISPDLEPDSPNSWLNSPEFQQHTTTHASNSQRRLRGRIEYVRDMLLGAHE